MFSGLEIEVDSICQNGKTGARFAVLPFSSSHSGCENEKSDVKKRNWKTRKLEKCDHENGKRPFSRFPAGKRQNEKSVTSTLGKIENVSRARKVGNGTCLIHTLAIFIFLEGYPSGIPAEKKITATFRGFYSLPENKFFTAGETDSLEEK